MTPSSGTIRALVLRTAGTNCDAEMVHAWELAGAEADRVHVNELVAGGGARLGDYQVLVFPGGFTYGDDIAAGKILANEVQAHLGDAVRTHIDRGGLVLGVCNGFQLLVKMGLLPGPGPEQTATLTFNDSNRFEDRWIHVKVETDRTPFLTRGDVFALPVAHGEGKFVVRDDAEIARLEEAGQIALRYVDAEGRPGPYPVNPNGSMSDVAGICDATGRVFGLMPHPERHVYPHHHPFWTRVPLQEGEGLRCFRNAVRHLSG